jgi:protein tyrosine/serine phosphatase
VLIRADDLYQLTPEGLAALRASGVSRVLDLRGSEEVDRLPSPLAEDPVYRWTPFIDEAADRDRDPDSEPDTRAVYLGSVRRNTGHIAAAFRALADAPPGPVVVHCLAGKDRTGILVALALRVAGVPAEQVAADYAASDERAPFRAELGALADDAERQAFRDRHGCHPATILAVLDQLTREYGSVAGYLRQHGVTEAQLDAVRDRLREPTPPSARRSYSGEITEPGY